MRQRSGRDIIDPRLRDLGDTLTDEGGAITRQECQRAHALLSARHRAGRVGGSPWPNTLGELLMPRI